MDILNREFRCSCGKLLFKSPKFWGTIQIKCRHCRAVKKFEVKHV